MSDEIETNREKQKIVKLKDGELEVRNTKTIPINFRLKVHLKPALDQITGYFKVNDQSKALNMMIERFFEFKEEKLRKIQRMKEECAKWGINPREDL